MPENQNSNGNAGAVDKVVAPASTRPEWLPEKFKDPAEFRKAYDESEKKITGYGEAQKQLKAWEKWGDPGTIENRLNAYIEQELQKRIGAQRGQNTTSQPDKDSVDWDSVEDWSQLTPKQYRAAVQREMKSIAEEYWKRAEGELGKIQTNQQQRDQIMQSAWEAKMNDENLKDVPVGEIYKAMIEIASDKPENLMSLAITKLTRPKTEAQMRKEIEAEVRQNIKLEQDNKASEGLSGALNSRFGDKNKENGADRPKTKDGLRNFILKKHLEKGDITPGQL